MPDNQWSQYRQPMVEYIEQEFLFGDKLSISDEDSLRTSGIVDSTGVMNLIAFVESHFNLVLDDDDLVSKNFDTINGLCNLVHRKLGG